jgi:carboxyl-terminal processing protease
LQSLSVDRAFFLAAGVGYIRISSFEDKTPQQFGGHREVGRRPSVGLVLDLRNNPGGLVTAAIGTSSLFLQPGAKTAGARAARP